MSINYLQGNTKNAINDTYDFVKDIDSYVKDVLEVVIDYNLEVNTKKLFMHLPEFIMQLKGLQEEEKKSL